MFNKILIDILKESVERFYVSDSILAKTGGMEQACVFRIGLYLHEIIKTNPQFQNLDLDCEYNKNQRGTKRLDGVTVRPDLIIHQRNLNNGIANDSNTLIVEFKGWWSHDTSKDIDKLRKFTGLDEGYIYKLGIFVKLGA